MLRWSGIGTSVQTAVAAADDDDDDGDASQCDVTAHHPEHLLLIVMGPRSTTKLVF